MNDIKKEDILAQELNRVSGYPQRNAFDSVTNDDRLNLCDIAWFLKGLKHGGNSPFTDQEQTLEKIIKCISQKVREDDKAGNQRKSCFEGDSTYIRQHGPTVG